MTDVPPSPTSYLPPDRKPSWLRRGFWLLVVIGLLAGGGWAVERFGIAGAQSDDVLTATALRGDLPVIVTDRGELESAQSLQVQCEIDGGGKLVTIVPEGTRVEKGAEVGTFDTQAISDEIKKQAVQLEQAEGKVKATTSELEVQKNKAESEIEKARLALTLAEIDYESYEKGEFKVELDKRKGQLEIAKKEQKEAEENLAFTRGLVKQGFAQYAQIRPLELNELGKRYAVSQQEADLRVFQEFTYRRKITELKAKAEDAKRELDRTQKSQAAATEKAENELDAAVKTAELEKQALKRLTERLDKCVIKAPQDGIVIYFSRPWDPESRIRPGAQVYFQQPIFTLPDLNNMQVKLKVHESVVKKVQPGQTVTMQVDALPNQVLHGKVTKVASVAQSDGWRGGGVKEYQTEVSIDDLPKEAGLRPGMTAEVKILIRTVENALTVPVQSVTEIDGQHVAYVVGSAGVERRKLKVGESNEQLIQILEGMQEHERVALDARSRGAAELKRKDDESKKQNGEPKPEGDKTKPAAVAKS
jgi:HlyD family secretion protein